MTEYEAVIGLECHVELSTETKMFCGCRNTFGAPPNTNVCPVCLGHPGSLPVPNREAIRRIITIGLALGSEIAPHSLFHRKNYFYPDMPKNFQISQYDLPICVGGHLDVELPDGSTSRVGITRVHMEEDTGKTTHESATGRIHDAEAALVDFNRAGVPLVECVSEPDIRSPEEAGAYLRELRVTLESLDVSDVRMEEGSLRCDANVSMRPVGTEAFGTKVEIKNMNSVRSLERALDLRDRAADEGARGRRDDRAGDPPLERGRRRDRVDAFEGGSLRLPVLPRARHPGDRAVGRVHRGAAGRAARAATGTTRAVRGRARPEARGGPRAGRRSRRVGAVRETSRSAPMPSGCELGHAGSRRALEQARERRRRPHDPPGSLADLIALVGDGH